MALNPLQRGAIASNSSSDAIAKNTEVFQAIFAEHAKTAEPIELPGVFYVGRLYPSSPLHIRGDNRRRSQLRLGTDEPVLIDFNKNGINSSGSIFERISFVGRGRDHQKPHAGIRFRANGKSNRDIKVVDCLFADWSDAGVWLPNSWNCHFADTHLSNCGGPAAGARPGAGIRLGYQDEPGDSLASTGNMFKNLYINGCWHGIDAQPGPYFLFTHFELIICEFNRVGIHCPSSKDCLLTHCYFEANTDHGAVMGHARHEACRHRPGTTNDIVINSDAYAWEPGVSHNEFFVTEKRLSMPNGDFRLLWAPRFGIITIASSSTLGPNGTFRVKTYGGPQCAPVAMMPGMIYTTGGLDGSTNPGKFTISADAEGGVWLQNRTGSAIDVTYHIMGTP